MDYNSLLLKFEIINLAIFLLYIFYYTSDKFFAVILRLRKIVWIKKREEEKIITKVEITEDKNLHADSYLALKVLITDDDKNKILDLLKKIKVNISKAEYDLAKNLIIEWLAIDKFNIELNIELASIYIREKDYIKAEYIYKDLLLVHTEDFDILKKLAYVLTMQEKYDLAIEMYKKANDLKSNDLEVINMLWNLYYHKELYIDSINFLKQYIKENPRETDNIILLASSYRNIWKINDAINTYKRVLEIEPYNEGVKKEISQLELLEYWDENNI